VHRFFAPSLDPGDETVVLPREEAEHLTRVLRLTPEEFVEEEVTKVLPQWRRDLRGTHTLNICDDLTVIDCLVHRRR